jgi:predicted ABC-type ATPase
MPNLYIISGCNGAGKTTASFTVLPEMLECKEFVNADEIARGLSPFQPESVAIQAGKIMLLRIEELLSQQKDFAIKKAQQLGYHVTLLFFWLNDVRLAIERVAVRVQEGGHHIPENVIERRYSKGIFNLNLFTSIADYWVLIDNSLGTMEFVAEGNFDKEKTIFVKESWFKLNGNEK